MRKCWTLACAALLVGACAVPFTQVRGPDGRHAYVMSCNGFMVTGRDCTRLARKLCPRGYHFVDERSMANSPDARLYKYASSQSGTVALSCN